MYALILDFITEKLPDPRSDQDSSSNTSLYFHPLVLSPSLPGLHLGKRSGSPWVRPSVDSVSPLVPIKYPKRLKSALMVFSQFYRGLPISFLRPGSSSSLHLI